MSKSLAQITFEFIEPKQPESLPGKPAPLPQKPKKARGRKPVKDADNEVEIIEVPDDDELFKKQYYPISEVAAMFKVNTSQIRFWENEFDILKPRKNRKGDRYFKPEDVKNLQLIHDLIRRRKFTVEGAKAFLKSKKSAQQNFEMIQSLEKLKSFLLEMKASL